MRKFLFPGKMVDKSRIDAAVSERDPEFLANLICAEDLSSEVKEHLATTVFELLSSKIKFPRRRPKKRSLDWERRQVGERVWETKKRKAFKKISSAVADVAKDLGLSQKTVWKCWSAFDVLGYELRREKLEHDAMIELAYEARWEAAVESLREEHGDREFTDEEIEAEAKVLDEALRDYDY
jgi:hypothetical protein